MSYNPFPIANFSVGKVTARDPWLLPKDAFESMVNCHLKRGVLEKRKGYTQFGQFVHTDTATGEDTNPGNPVMGIYNHYQKEWGPPKVMMMLTVIMVELFLVTMKTLCDYGRLVDIMIILGVALYI